MRFLASHSVSSQISALTSNVGYPACLISGAGRINVAGKMNTTAKGEKNAKKILHECCAKKIDYILQLINKKYNMNI